MISRAPCLRRVQNHFADAECGRQERIAFTFGKSSHSCGFAHFHYGKLSVGDPGVTRVDLTPERIVRLAFHPRTAKRIANNLRSSLAAISHRHDVDLCITQNAAQSERDVLCNFASAKRAFEFIGRDKDFQ